MPRRLLWLAISVVAAALCTPAFAAKQKPMSDEEVNGLFATTCGWCHQNGGRDAGKGPKLAGTKRSDAFITNRIKHGKEGAMPAFDGTLNDAQIKGIIHYIRHLKSD
ncbi:MAG TPA: cytochrome c [Stellaceae bacterium]